MSDDSPLVALARHLAPLVADILRGADSTLIGQRESPLGPRRHCAAVRARIKSGKTGASVVGRRFYLTRAALDEEIRTIGARIVVKPAAKPDPLTDLAKRLPLQRSAV